MQEVNFNIDGYTFSGTAEPHSLWTTEPENRHKKVISIFEENGQFYAMFIVAKPSYHQNGYIYHVCDGCRKDICAKCDSAQYREHTTPIPNTIVVTYNDKIVNDLESIIRK